MSDGFPFLDILFFALIALFVVLRLRAVLGRRTGSERKHADPFSRSAERPKERPGNVVRLPERQGHAPASAEDDELFERPAEPASTAGGEPQGEPATDSAHETTRASVGQEVRAGLTQIKVADPNFDAREFMSGARAAFGMVVEAFARGDTGTLRPLLGDDVYDRFAAEVRARLATGQTADTKVQSIESADMVSASMNGRTAVITIRFTSQQLTVQRAASGEVISGDPDSPVRVTEQWTFTRNTRARDPNWSLVETRAVA